MMHDTKDLRCPVCGNKSPLFDVVDFNKSCEEAKGKFLPRSGMPIYYARCDACEFCYSPEISAWPLETFEQKIYNSEYINIDPDYVDVRPRVNVSNIVSLFGNHSKSIRHLDYGGGEGLLSKLLCDAGFDSVSYDPFVNKKTDTGEIGTFDLITAFEVFEHVPDVHALMKNLSALLRQNGLVFFSTLLSDGNIVKNQRLTWWYASPRNGHISLFSKKSLAFIGSKYGFNLVSFDAGFHAYFRQVPDWASHLIKKA